MARYFFVIKKGPLRGDDEEGTPLHDDDEAQNYARQVIRELKEGGGYEDGDWTMIVFAEGGRQVCTVAFSTVSIEDRSRRVS